MNILNTTGYIVAILITFIIYAATGAVCFLFLATLPHVYMAYPEPIIHTMIALVSGVAMYAFYYLFVYALKQLKSYFTW